jgi:hypothetical protein
MGVRELGKLCSFRSSSKVNTSLITTVILANACCQGTGGNSSRATDVQYSERVYKHRLHRPCSVHRERASVLTQSQDTIGPSLGTHKA